MAFFLDIAGQIPVGDEIRVRMPLKWRRIIDTGKVFHISIPWSQCLKRVLRAGGEMESQEVLLNKPKQPKRIFFDFSFGFW